MTAPRSIWFRLIVPACAFVAITLASCSSEPDITPVVFEGEDAEDGGQPPPGSSNDDKYVWLFPSGRVQDGGPGKDGIWALMNPSFRPVESTSYLLEDDLVLGINFEGTVKAYPHRILDWHEIANDMFGGWAIAITYCPLTGSGIAFNSSTTLNEIAPNAEREPTFGVSGFLWNNNLIPYDRPTDSNWSQMLLWCVNGPSRGERAWSVPLIETTWATWKKMFPGSLVLSDETGHDRPYDIFPYGDYKTDPFLLFPISLDDERLPRKARVHGVILDPVAMQAKAYPFQLFEGQIRAINDEAGTVPVVVAGSGPDNIVVSYRSRLSDGTPLQYSVKTDSPSIYPFDLVDNEGTIWNLLGEAIEGPRKGDQLQPTTSYNAYWFAWGSIFPNLPIYGR